MDTEALISIKSLTDCCLFNEDKLEKIKSYFKESNIKYVKKNKKTSNILKNSTFNLKKNKINNKIIFILNKLSTTNINNIIIEFIENIKIDNEECFSEIQNIIFEKIFKDIKFIDIYCDFLIKIIKYINVKYKYLPNNLLEIIDNYILKFNSKQEQDRLNFLNFISIMINKKFFNESVIKEISNLLINLKLIPDIKFWFLKYKLDKQCLKNFQIKNTREKLLYESIFEDKDEVNKIIKK